MKKWMILAVAFMYMCIPALSPAENSITVCGTGDSQDVLRELAANYEKAHPGNKVNVPDSIGSTGGIEATAKGECDLGRVARAIKEKEKSLGLNYKVFAKSPVVFVVNNGVGSVDNLTQQQIIDIFAGKTKKWSEVGGKAVDVYVVNREEGDSSRGVLEKTLPGFKEIGKTVGITIEHDTPKTIETIGKTPGAIGYTSFASVDKSSMKVLKINGVAPTRLFISKGEYPHVSPFALVWKGELKGLAKEFFDYVFSEPAKNITLKFGVFPVE